MLESGELPKLLNRFFRAGYNGRVKAKQKAPQGNDDGPEEYFAVFHDRFFFFKIRSWRLPKRALLFQSLPFLIQRLRNV